ncbi:MAG TPA: MATE family efflux transporter, partial [Candidatus Limnocylindria bacterium]|nr:MATE family efflux transporter [Candidatus Limnocylindria bacterium]
MQRHLRAWLEDAFTTGQFTWAQLRGMFLTLLLDQFFIVFIGLLAMALVSSSGQAAMAAVSMVGTVVALMTLTTNAVAMGGSILVARAKGGGSAAEVRRALGQTVGLCGALGLALGMTGFLLAGPLVEALYPRAEPLLRGYAALYMRLMAISVPFISVFSAVFYAMRALGNARAALFQTVAINGLHLAFNVLFIRGMGLGVLGAGLGYIAARALGMALALTGMRFMQREYRVRLRHMARLTRSGASAILRLGLPIAWESALMQGGMLLVHVYLARLSTADIAAHGIANSVLSLYVVSGGALTALAATVCGQCWGAGLPALTRRYCVKIIQAGRAALLLSVLVLVPLTPLLLRLFRPSPEAEPVVRAALLIAAAGLPLLWSDANVTPMALRAAGDSVYPGLVSAGALALGRLGLGYVLAIPLGMG